MLEYQLIGNGIMCDLLQNSVSVKRNFCYCNNNVYIYRMKNLVHLHKTLIHALTITNIN